MIAFLQLVMLVLIFFGLRTLNKNLVQIFDEWAQLNGKKMKKLEQRHKDDLLD